MRINYYEPLKRGWDRMEEALFHPFDIVKWFTLGFTAFLAGLTDFHGGGNNNNYGHRHKADWDDVFDFPQTVWEWLMDNTFWFGLIIFGLIFLFALGIIFTWLSSRGKFMFLHNVVHNKAEVKKPWNNYRLEGNSLFIWRLFFGIICFIMMIGLLIFTFIMVRNMVYNDLTITTRVFMILGLIMQFLFLFAIIAYISLFLNDFVVPIMFKHRISASRGWTLFLRLLNQHPGAFFLYGLYIFVLGLLVALCVLLFGLFTCCIGLVLLIIPYIGSVLFLPVSYTFRAFSIEFLEQFGEEYKFFPTEEEEASIIVNP